MKPEPTRFIEVAAAHLMLKTAPALGGGYEQASTLVLGMLLNALGEEFDRAAAWRVEENRALRGIFADAAPVVADTGLAERLEVAARGEDASLAVSDLERSNAGLRGLLIELHARVEELPGADARRIEFEIWRELAASTERRKLAMGTV